MLRVICPNCDKEHEYAEENQAAVECWACSHGLAAGLRLVCQNTRREIEIPAVAAKAVLGRENIGREIFSGLRSNGVAIISRQHCSIEYLEGNFYLRDEGSLNGTFYGENKINCRHAPQRIEHDKLIFFGKEPFAAKLIYNLSETRTAATPVEEIKTIKKYRCTGCGAESELFSEDCPACGKYGLKEIYG